MEFQPSSNLQECRTMFPPNSPCSVHHQDSILRFIQCIMEIKWVIQAGLPINHSKSFLRMLLWYPPSNITNMIIVEMECTLVTHRWSEGSNLTMFRFSHLDQRISHRKTSTKGHNEQGRLFLPASPLFGTLLSARW